MIRILAICCVFIVFNVFAAVSQGTDPQESPLKKYTIRPSSKEYAAVRRGNSFQPVSRSKTPTLRSQQIQTDRRATLKPDRKNAKRNRVASIRKNRRIRNK
jgi:hypothetical protein